MTDFPRAEANLLARFARLPAANIGDAMDRLGVLDSRIGPVWPGARLVGRAFTVWTRSGDNQFVHKALDAAEPGDVIVVNGGGDESRALIGDLIGQRAKNRGLAGFVIDGAVRDAEGLGEIGIPVFARAVTPAGPYKNGPGHLGRTIAVGGVAVAPGDILVGDADGVVVIPLAEAASIAEAAEAVLARETGKRAAILESA
ncbi:RraA family protein [Streptosporangium soli]|nr:methyltransferase [Streptosporangium sp. KLBMP 9127]